MPDNNTKPQRIYALDSLRGLAIALMILVNTPGSWNDVYAGLVHAPWHGFRLADIVFPMFLFAVGAGMYFSMQRSAELPLMRRQLKVLKRAALIVLIGLLLNAFPFTQPLSELRWPGVLQRIGLAYAIAATLVLYCSNRWLYVLSAAFLLGYWLMLCAYGVVEPFALETNLVRHIDVLLLGPAHMYAVKGIPFDPEGLVSTLPAVVSVFAGYLATAYLQGRGVLNAGVLMRIVAVALGLMLMAFLWSFLQPINKSLWTGSYVLLSSGIILLLLSAFIWLQDVLGYKKLFKPLIIYGINPLFVYIIAWLWTSSLFNIAVVDENPEVKNAYDWLYQYFLAFASPGMASLLFALAHVMLFWLLAYALYRKNIIIKI